MSDYDYEDLEGYVTLEDMIDGNVENSDMLSVTLRRKVSLLDCAYALTASANSKVGPARHVSRGAVREVVLREHNLRVGQNKNSAYFGVVRAVENFLSVATQNNASTPHIDLLPLGHPNLPQTESLTASAYAVERAEWEAGILDAPPTLKGLVASVLSSDPNSAEYKFAVARLKTAAPDVLKRL